ncbi:hypothetical protein [Novipirellula artificiosorum]|uniref:hypothetical protein n=1 Tax=Novipirellula artificiosorum TaxID=2528016 RepID=UPI0011B4A207|nr:hypothetical protein [Novipirellula artificiosorum]
MFKKYIPLCKGVSEAGWEPITLARSSDPSVYVERFGNRFLTVFNDSPTEQRVAIELDPSFPSPPSGPVPELVSGENVQWRECPVDEP